MEIHAANGYLIDQFLQSKTNHRTDRYGGAVENRFRFLKEIVEAILTVWPAHRVDVRLSRNGNFNDMGAPDFRETSTHAEESHGGTLCRDLVRYRPRGGTLIHWLFVRRDVERIFQYRQQRLRELIEPATDS